MMCGALERIKNGTNLTPNFGTNLTPNFSSL